MIEPTTLARPYARAAFEHARSSGQLASWQAALSELASEAVVNLLAIMSDNDRLSLLPEVAALFEQLKQSIESTVAVHVTTAYPLTEAEEQALSESMHSKLDRSITLTSETDPSLLGGALIRADDLVIDGSVRGRLNKLAGTLTQ